MKFIKNYLLLFVLLLQLSVTAHAGPSPLPAQAGLPNSGGIGSSSPSAVPIVIPSSSASPIIVQTTSTATSAAISGAVRLTPNLFVTPQFGTTFSSSIVNLLPFANTGRLVANLATIPSANFTYNPILSQVMNPALSFGFTQPQQTGEADSMIIIQGKGGEKVVTLVDSSRNSQIVTSGLNDSLVMNSVALNSRSGSNSGGSSRPSGGGDGLGIPPRGNPSQQSNPPGNQTKPNPNPTPNKPVPDEYPYPPFTVGPYVIPDPKKPIPQDESTELTAGNHLNTYEVAAALINSWKPSIAAWQQYFKDHPQETSGTATDGSTVVMKPNGTLIITKPNGTVMTVEPDGQWVLTPKGGPITTITFDPTKPGQYTIGFNHEPDEVGQIVYTFNGKPIFTIQYSIGKDGGLNLEINTGSFPPKPIHIGPSIPANHA